MVDSAAECCCYYNDGNALGSVWHLGDVYIFSEINEMPQVFSSHQVVWSAEFFLRFHGGMGR